MILAIPQFLTCGLVIGLSRDKFEMIETLGNKLGLIQSENAKALLKIFFKYQNIIF